MSSPGTPVNVLIVDDSAMVRKVLTMGLEADRNIKVVGTAPSAAVARQMIQELRPDVVTLDIEMPRVDGLTFLREIMEWSPMPVVIITSLSRSNAEVTMQAMEAGAVDVIAKPSNSVDSGLNPIMTDVCTRVRSAAGARIITKTKSPIPERKPDIPRPSWPMGGGQRLLGIGSSTGGVQALSMILPNFPADSPAILIVQHMPEGFTSSFAKRLNTLCKMDVREAQDGDLIQDGTVLVAPGGQKHMTVRRTGQLYRVQLQPGPAVNFSRPSIDVLFFSMAQSAGPSTTAAVLTGMGKDGAEGLLAIKESGGTTFAQDEATCVVYGMPAAAAQIGAAQQVAPLDAIPTLMLNGTGSFVDRPAPQTGNGMQDKFANPPPYASSRFNRG